MTEIIGFDAEQVEQLTGLTRAQLRYWDSTDFFKPSLDYRHPGYGPIYSFRDVVALRTIALLREEVPLQELRLVKNWLFDRSDTWTTLKLGSANKKVVFYDPETGGPEEALSGQDVLEIDVGEVERDVRKKVEELSTRRSAIGQIDVNRRVIRNSPTVAGTRIRTSSIWSFSEAGYSVAEILKEYPNLKRKDVLAAIEHEKVRRSAA